MSTIITIALKYGLDIQKLIPADLHLKAKIQEKQEANKYIKFIFSKSS
jgi:hypothetical protein